MTLAEELRALAEDLHGRRDGYDSTVGELCVSHKKAVALADALLALAARAEREQAFLAAVEDAVSKMQPGGPGTTIFLQGLVGLPDAYRAYIAAEEKRKEDRCQ